MKKKNKYIYIWNQIILRKNYVNEEDKRNPDFSHLFMRIPYRSLSFESISKFLFLPYRTDVDALRQ